MLASIVPTAMRRRIDQWIALRNPAARDVIQLHNRRLYILPTRFGYLYALMLFVLLLASINYQNSMSYALTFLLTAIGIISLWQTHRNLLGLNIRLKTPEAVFQGEQLTLNFEIENPQQNIRYAIGVQYDQQSPAYSRVDPQHKAKLELILPALKRGLYKPGGITLFTRYPTGLFHAWGWLKFDVPILIYPQPRFDHQLEHILMEQHSGKTTVDMADGDDFAGLREHRQGESLRHISWKAYAQGRGMLTKTFQGHANPSLWINWSDMSANSLEGKLSQMTALVIEAQQQGRKFGMKLPGIDIEQDSGSAHRALCLQHLATFKQNQENSELSVSE